MNISEHYEAWQALTSDWPSAPRHQGATCQQHQSDLDRYAEVIRELKPPWLIQTGIYWGGTMAFLADVMHEVNPDSRCMFVDTDLSNCRVSSRDLPNTEIVMGNAIAPAFAKMVREFSDERLGLISLDDLHTREQVAVELELYAGLASYLVVEDTILAQAVGTVYQASNPRQALDAWLPHHPEFAPDPDPEPTQHVGGWLRRVG